MTAPLPATAGRAPRPRPPGGPPPRLLALAALVVVGLGLAVLLALGQRGSPLISSLATPFQWLGAPVKLADRLASRVVPVGSLEERQLGDLYRQGFDRQVKVGDPVQAYLDALMVPVRSRTRRPFPYRAYRLGPQGVPNAVALPGGVILVTDELLATLGSEAELVAVLAHEAGHIELGHCFDAVRFQLLSRRSGNGSVGELADQASQLLLRHAFSKGEEHEADAYAFQLLIHSPYDPAALGASFASLRRSEVRASAGDASPAAQHADPLRDYFRSHPPTAIREAEFSQEGTSWWRRHPRERRYVGVRNLRLRLPMARRPLPQEWRRGPLAG